MGTREKEGSKMSWKPRERTSRWELLAGEGWEGGPLTGRRGRRETIRAWLCAVCGGEGAGGGSLFEEVQLAGPEGAALCRTAVGKAKSIWAVGWEEVLISRSLRKEEVGLSTCSTASKEGRTGSGPSRLRGLCQNGGGSGEEMGERHSAGRLQPQHGALGNLGSCASLGWHF